MTWGVQIAKGDGTKSTQSSDVCGECRHGGDGMNDLPYRYGHPVCNVRAAASSIGYLLTAIDVGADSHMAAGNAVLCCHGFEPKQQTEASAP